MNERPRNLKSAFLDVEQGVSMFDLSLGPINEESLAILKHTRSNNHGLFCGDSPEMQTLVELGLMESAGCKAFVPDEYFRLTQRGKDFLNEAGI